MRIKLIKQEDFILIFLSTVLLIMSSCGRGFETVKDSDNDGLSGNNSGGGTTNPPPTEEWVTVPANAGGLSLPSFRVMKYEAKALRISNNTVILDGGNPSRLNVSDFRPVSVADSKPWVNISPTEASSRCQSLGAGYDLISNAEWMALAREIEAQDANWSGSTVGSGRLFHGNSDSTTVGSYDSATDPDYGNSRNLRAIHVLSSGAEIYDLAGNVSEFVDWDRSTPGVQTTPNCGATSGELMTDPCSGTLVANDYLPANPASVLVANYNQSAGLGFFYSLAGNGYAFRGGDYRANDTGIFNIYLNFLAPLNGYNAFTGFRCVYRP